jgi:hypothetical protein
VSYQEQILAELADHEASRISRKVIRILQGMKDLLSGEDSNLGNTWNEICLQVQTEPSFSWDAYRETIERLVLEEVRKAPTLTRQIMWLQTDPGQDWAFEADSVENESAPAYKSAPFVDDGIVDYICREYVLSKAADWSNAAIRRALERDLRHD